MTHNTTKNNQNPSRLPILPWRFDDISIPTCDDGLGYIYGDLPTHGTCIAHTGDVYFSKVENVAIGTLFAAAPDLLEALELALSAFDNSLRSAGTSPSGFIATRRLMEKAQAKARAAIAKAMGG